MQDVAHILAAMTPCSRLYAYLGCQLEEQFPGHNHQFSAWIKTYSAPDYLTLAAKNEELLDLLADKFSFGTTANSSGLESLPGKAISYQ